MAVETDKRETSKQAKQGKGRKAWSCGQTELCVKLPTSIQAGLQPALMTSPTPPVVFLDPLPMPLHSTHDKRQLGRQLGNEQTDEPTICAYTPWPSRRTAWNR